MFIKHTECAFLFSYASGIFQKLPHKSVVMLQKVPHKSVVMLQKVPHKSVVMM